MVFHFVSPPHYLVGTESSYLDIGHAPEEGVEEVRVRGRERLPQF
jgi:hypothetical protein